MPKKKEKKPHEMTSEELARHLFPPEVVEHAKGVAKEATERVEKRAKPSIKDKGK